MQSYQACILKKNKEFGMPVRRKIFVINLKDSVERYNYVKSQFDKLGLEIERIEGVDADSLTQDNIKEVYSSEKNRKTYVRPLHKGQIACYMAHIKAWRAIVEQDLDYAFVLEDDVIVGHNFLVAMEFLDTHFGQWDFVRLQRNSKPKKIFFEKFLGNFSFVQYINTTGGAFAQAISGSAAKGMLDNLLPFGMPVDVNQQYYYKFGICVESLRPPVVSMGEIGDSSILRKYDTNNREHHPFVRQKLSLKFYIGRITRLMNEYGILVFVWNIILMSFRKPVR